MPPVPKRVMPRPILVGLRVVFILLLLVVLWLSMMPQPETVPGAMNLTRWLAERLFGDAGMADKVAHLIAYAALGGTAVLARLRTGGRYAVTALVIFGYSLAIEIAQGLGGARRFDVTDLVANALGIAAGMGAALFLVGAMRTLRPRAAAGGEGT